MSDLEKSMTCLLSVNEGDVKVILINLERRGKVEQGPISQAAYSSSVLMMWGSSRKHSNVDKANMLCFFIQASIF